MEVNNMKNIVVLKNLPSNIVEEEIVILKDNKEARKLEYIEKNTNGTKSAKKNKKEYMVKEAESVISNYICKIEDNKNSKSNLNIEKKYKKLKIYSIVASIILLLKLFL